MVRITVAHCPSMLCAAPFPTYPLHHLSAPDWPDGVVRSTVAHCPSMLCAAPFPTHPLHHLSAPGRADAWPARPWLAHGSPIACGPLVAVLIEFQVLPEKARGRSRRRGCYYPRGCDRRHVTRLNAARRASRSRTRWSKKRQTDDIRTHPSSQSDVIKVAKLAHLPM